VKSIWKSKTFWLNALTASVAIADQIHPTLPESAGKWLVMGVAIVNIFLRTITTQPVAIRATSTKGKRK
jgi:hypothetical protein